MNEAVRIGVNSVFDAISAKGGGATTVVLVGSGARDATNSRSDLDILVIDRHVPDIRLQQPGNVHLQQFSRSEFMGRLEDGDDYPGWALRFGIPMHDPDGWWAKQVAMELENPHWPDWEPKLKHAEKRMNMASALLEVGDNEAASEEFMFAASHIARAMLIKRGVFPLSRPELPSQLEDVEPELAQVLSRLILENMDTAHLIRIESFLRRQVESLSQKSEERYSPRTAETITVPLV